MNHTRIFQILLVLFAVVLCFGPVGLAGPMGTAFTYQGRLIDANNAADGLYDLQFLVCEVDTNGVWPIGEVNKPEVDVIDGYFTVELDFGDIFYDYGEDLWLEIGVRPGDLNDPNVYTFLSPLQKITPTPYALYAKTAGNVFGMISGTGTSNYIPKFISYNSIGNSIIYETAGNVGIGTIYPTAKMEVAGQVKITGGSPAAGKVLTSDSSGLANWQTLTETDPTVLASVKDGVSWGEVSGIPAGFADGIDDVGAGDNLGNHTATQNILLSGYWLSGDGGNEGVYVTNTGNVGIGTTSPAAKLDVSGDISTTSIYKIGGNTVLSVAGTQNTLLGVGAGAVNTGNYNTFSGYQAGWSNTVGYENTFSGGLAGFSNTTGYYNTFLGYSAGHSNKTGYDNTFIGNDAGNRNTNGDENTFVGADTGFWNSTGEYNTCVGTAAGLNIKGDRNVLIGYQAGLSESGSNKLYIANGYDDANVLIYGDFATGRVGISLTNPTEALDVDGRINSSESYKLDGTTVLANNGPNSIFVGPGAGINNTTGNGNSAMGYYALVANNTGNSNTAVGNLAGYSNSTGNRNVFLGNLAGLSNSTGSNNVFLGNLAGYNETGSNKLYIANDLLDASVLIYGDFSTGRVGLGTKTLNYRLQLPNIAGADGQGQANAWQTYSSRRWKTDIKPIENALGKVQGLRGVYFDWKSNGKHDIGMIAEEVAEVIPEVVGYEEDGKDASSMDYARLVALLVEAVKEQQKEIAVLKDSVSRNQSLEQRLEAMESIVANLSQQEGGIK